MDNALEINATNDGAGSMTNVGGYNPYRRENGEFSTKEEAGAQILEDYKAALDEGNTALSEAIFEYVSEKMPDSELGREMLTERFGSIASHRTEKTKNPSAHAWAGTLLASPHATDKKPSSGDFVIFKDHLSGSIMGGYVESVGLRGGKPYVIVAEGLYGASYAVWPEGDPKGEKQGEISVRAKNSFPWKEYWEGDRVPWGTDEELEMIAKNLDDVDYLILEERRDQVTDIDPDSWDDPAHAKMLERQWRKFYSIADKEFKSREKRR